MRNSEAFSVNNSLATLIKFFMCDPHGLKFIYLRENGTTKPARVFSVSWGIDLWSHWGGSKGLNFFLHALLHAVEHGATTSKDDILEKIFLDVILALHD